MNFEESIVWILVSAFLLGLVFFKKKKNRYLNMMTGAEVFLNEQSIHTLTPVPLHGKPDQVLQLRDGRLLIIDTKNRFHQKIYPSDITQLSVYRVILKNNGYRLCDFALIRFPSEKNTSAVFKQTRLLSEKEIINLYNRYHKIKRQEINPICRCHKH